MKHCFLVLSFLISSHLAQATDLKIKGLDALGIPYKAESFSFRAVDAKRMPSDNLLLDIEVGPLTKAQYQALSDQLSSASLPEFKEGAKYKLVQFLPPLLQAVNGWQFKPREEAYKWPDLSDLPEDDISEELRDIMRFKDNNTPLITLINCWTTVYEFLRLWKDPSSNEFDIIWLSRGPATGALTDEYMNKLSPREKLRFGDVLIYSAFDKGPGIDLVQHAAIFILPGLYFEKTDSTEDDAFRFVTEKDLSEKYKKLLKSSLKVAHYRVKKEAKLARLAETQNLFQDADFYGKYFSEKDMKTITFAFDWITSLGEISSPVFEPYRIYSISLQKKERGFVLDTTANIFTQFRQPQKK